MSCCVVSAKIRRSVKAGGLVLALGLVAALAARPFVALVDDDAPLDPVPPAYTDYESEHAAAAEIGEADSELADRAGRPVEKVVAVGSGDTLTDLLLRAGVDPTEAGEAVTALRERLQPAQPGAAARR